MDTAATVADQARLAALRATRLLDSEEEEPFDRLTRLAVRLVGVPAAFISLVDEHRDFYKSVCGFGEPLATSRELSGPTFCHHAILSAAPLVIPDTAADPRYQNIPTVRTLGVAAYLGIPIIVGGQPIGAFCAIDVVPHPWSAGEIDILTELAASARREIVLRTSERDAREMSARLSVAMEAAQLGAWSYDIATATGWNAAEANRILGRGHEEGLVPADQWLAAVHADDRAAVGDAFRRACEESGRYAVEYRVHWPDRSVHWVRAAGTLLRDDGGRPARLVGTIEDITIRRRTEEAVRTSEQRLRAFVEAVPMLAWMNDANGVAAYFNQRWYDYTGQDAGVLRDGGWMVVIHPDDADRMRALRTMAVYSQEPYEVEVRIRRHDGEYRWHVARVAPSLDAQGNVIGWAGGALDIDDRRRLEQELRASEARFRLVQDSSPDGSVLLQPVRDAEGAVVDFRFTYANSSAGRILAEEPVSLVGLSVRDTFPDSDVRIPAYARVLETGEPFQTEVFHTRANVRRGLRIAAVRVDGRVHVAFADLTERLQAAEERERLLTAERAAHAAAEAARREAEQANAVKAQFLATMSHELRTPLNAIGGYAQLIELGVHGPVSAGQADALSRIQRSQKHLLGLIAEVLSYAKLEAGAATFHLEELPALEIVRGVEALVAPQARAKEIALAVDASTPELAVRADAEKGRQVVLNLLSNAVKFTAPGGRVEVRCRERPAVGGAPAMVEISVADTGRGIAPDQLARVFAPFVQVGRELTSEQAGTGLGLAISRDLARAMGGDITATSEQGVGSTFVFTLPRA